MTRSADTPDPAGGAGFPEPPPDLQRQRRAEQQLLDTTAALEARTVELEQSLSLLHATLEASPDGIVALDRAGRVLVHNRTYAAMWSLPAELLASRDADRLAQHLADRTLDGSGFLARSRHLHQHPEAALFDVVELKDGRMFERHASPRMAGSDCVGTVISWRDVTERRRAELALRQSEAELRRAQRLAQVGSWHWTLEDDRMSWSDEVWRLFRRTPARSAPAHAAQEPLYAPASWRRFDAAIRATQATGRPYALDLEIRRADGSSGWVHGRGEAERDLKGRIVALRGSLHDITDAREAQRALRESQQRLQALFDHALNAIFLMDDERRIVDANPAACRLTGRAREELLRQPADLLIAAPLTAAATGEPAPTTPPAASALQASPVSRAASAVPGGAAPPLSPRSAGVPAERWRALLQEGQQHGLLRLVRADGSRIVAEYNAVARVQPGLHLAMLSDVTARRQAEALRVGKEAAETANRSKSAFVSRMSHELRTPLNAILGFSEVLALDAHEPLQPEQRVRVGRIRTAAEHLLNLIEDVLDVSRMETGTIQLRLETFSPAETVRDAVRQLKPAADQRSVGLIMVEPPPAGWAVQADRTRLKQVALNLVSNGIKYNRPGGTVTVRLDIDDGRLAIRVEDSGLGMDADQLANLFQAFNRLGRESSGVEGTGMGLVISRNLVELMGGSLAVESRVGRGSRFSVLLPLAEAEARLTMPGQLPPLPAAAAGVRGRVLYVDDDEVNRLLMEAYFALRPGVDLHLAKDGQGGIDAAARLAPDLVLIDMRLPDMSGLDVRRGIGARGGLHTPPCIAVSADAMPEQIAEALAAGFDGYLTKPLAAAKVLAKVDEVLLNAAAS